MLRSAALLDISDDHWDQIHMDLDSIWIGPKPDFDGEEESDSLPDSGAEDDNPSPIGATGP